MTAPKNKPPGPLGIININTVLLGIIVALSGWTLNRVQGLSEKMAAVTVQTTTTERDLDIIRVRLATVEAQVLSNSLNMARAQQQQNSR